MLQKSIIKLCKTDVCIINASDCLISEARSFNTIPSNKPPTSDSFLPLPWSLYYPLPCEWCFCPTVQLQAGGRFPLLPPLPGPCLSWVTYVYGSFIWKPAWFCALGRKTPPMSTISHKTGFPSSSAGTQKNQIPLILNRSHLLGAIQR